MLSTSTNQGVKNNTNHNYHQMITYQCEASDYMMNTSSTYHWDAKDQTTNTSKHSSQTQFHYKKMEGVASLSLDKK